MSLRLRLAILHGVLFFISAAGLVAITVAVTGWLLPPQSAGSANSGESHRYQLELVTGLIILAAVAGALGWLAAGRILRPLRAITAATRQISEDDLDRRLAMPGRGNELKDLADTIDGLLARLQAAFDAQRNFIASAAHELRTPLTLERAMLEVALADPDATADALRSACEEVLAVGQQQEQLIEALLTLARSQRGLDHRELTDLAAIFDDVLCARGSDAARHELTISSSLTAAPVLGDTRLLRRLAANLVDNAIRHNIRNGRIDIQVTASGGQARLTMSNTGPVIPFSHAARLLEPFQRRSGSRLADADGLGLGLSIVVAIVRAHHGTLTVHPGRHGGLDIDVSLPAASQAPLSPRGAVGRQATATMAARS